MNPKDHHVPIELQKKLRAEGDRLTLMSIYGLLAYGAAKQKIDESILRETVKMQFNVDDIRQLPSDSYDKVIQFIVDVLIDRIVH